MTTDKENRELIDQLRAFELELHDAGDSVHSFLMVQTVIRLEAAYRERIAVPINMLLFCPRCHVQHVDAPETKPDEHDDRVPITTWTNPPHRSHLCHHCGFIWRPADVPTNGVASIRTQGKNDSPPPAAPLAAQQEPTGWAQGVEAVAKMLEKKADDYALEYGSDDMGALSFGQGSHALAKLEYHSNLLELAEDVRAMIVAAPHAVDSAAAVPTDKELSLWSRFDGSWNALRELFDPVKLAANRADPAYGWDKIKAAAAAPTDQAGERERHLEILEEVLDAKEVMLKAGCKQAPFGEMFAQYAALRTAPAVTAAAAGEAQPDHSELIEKLRERYGNKFTVTNTKAGTVEHCVGMGKHPLIGEALKALRASAAPAGAGKLTDAERWLVESLIEEVDEYAGSRSFKAVEAEWRSDLLVRARAFLAARADDGSAS